MSEERDILKTLLLKEELEQLESLNQKFLSKEQFTEEVANVLSVAIHRAQSGNNALDMALSRPIKKGVTRVFSQNKQIIIDSLLPIMGQLIRKTVANSIKQFVTDINRTLELGFSAKAIKWRYQAFKAGIPFGQMVFQKTIRYQVRDLFLINRSNGLLIEHAGEDDLLKDKNAISAMLTVIQDFIGDSLQTPGADLLSAEIKDSIILISTGPHAYLAMNVKGSPTTRLKVKSQKLIENIHAKFSIYLNDETQYRNNPDLKDYLRTNLITKSMSEKTNKINWLPWLLILTVTLSSLIYWSYKRNQQFNDALKKVQSIDGLYLQSIKRNKSGYQVDGLLDPLADISILKNSNITLNSRPFISLDTKIINQRIEKIVSLYGKTKFRYSLNTVYLSGVINSKNKQKLISQLENLRGINKIDTQVLNILSEIKPPIKKPNFNNALIKQINNSVIFLPNREIKGKEKLHLYNLIKSLHSILESGSKISITLTGESDCSGALSNQFSLQRAQSIKSILVEKGINKDIIKTKIKNCQNFISEPNNSLLNVHLKIISLTQVQK